MVVADRVYPTALPAVLWWMAGVGGNQKTFSARNMVMRESDFEVAFTKTVCPVCAEKADGDLIMNKVLNPSAAKKVKDLHGKVIGWEFCPRCRDAKKAGAVFLIEVDPTKSTVKNGAIDLGGAYRTGRFWGITHDAFCRLFDVEKVSNDIVFIEPEVTAKLGLDKISAQSSTT